MEIDERYMKFTVSVSGISHSIQRIKDFALTPYGLKGRNVNCLSTCTATETGSPW
jgi:hypothetical protein